MKTKWNLLVVLALALALFTPAQTVYAEQAPVTYTFTASPEPSGYEEDVTFTLDAAGEYVDPGTGFVYRPFGYVDFYDNAVAIYGCSNVALNGGRNPQDGVYIPATCTVSMNTPGLHTITASVVYEVSTWFANTTVTLAGGHTVSDPLPLTLTPDSLADFMYGGNYGASIPVLISVSGGDGSYYFQYPVLNLPAGLQVETYNTNSAWVHGRPAELGTGYSFTMTVGDYNGYRSSKTYTFDVITNTPTINVFDRVYNAGDYDMDLLATMDYPIVTGLQPPSGTLAFSLDGVPVENCSAIQTADTSRYCLLSGTSSLTVGDHTITVVYTPDEAASPYYNSSTGTGTLTVNSALGLIYGAFFVDADQDGAKDADEDNYIDHNWVVTLNQACDSDISNDRTATIASGDYYFRFPDTPTGYRYCITVALPEGYTQTTTPDFTLSGESFFDVGVYWPQLTFNPAQLPSGTPNEAYNQTITISGGEAPYTISNESFQCMGPGLTFNSDDLTVSGTATAPNYCMLSFHAVDVNGLAGDFSSMFMFLLNGRFNLTSSANPSTSGDPVTFTFTGEGDYVDGTGQNIPPSGSVDFYDGDVPIPGCAGVPLNYNAVSPAECTATGLADGVHTIKAVFPEEGYSPYHGAELTLTQQVGTVPTTYTISGTLFNDLNENSVKDPSEEPMYHWSVGLDQGCDGSIDFYDEVDDLGQFSFADLTAGLCYRLNANPGNSPDWTQTTTLDDITLDADRSFEIGVQYTGLAISPESLLPGDKDVPFDQTLTVSGGTPPYSITVDQQWTFMPPGVTYTIGDDTITVSGTPTQAGAFVIVYSVQDSGSLSVESGSDIIIRGADATFTFTSALNPSVLDQEATLVLEGIGLDPDNPYLTPRGLVTFYADGVPIEGCVDLVMSEYYDESSGEWVDNNPVECKTAALTLGDHAITADFIADPEGIYNDATDLVLTGGHTVIETGFTISGIAFYDPDLDGVMDDGELGVADATVRFDAGCNESVNLSVTTAADGSYSAVLPGGQCYRISAFAPSMKQTAPVEDTLSADASGVNIGLMEVVLVVDKDSLPDGVTGEAYYQTITVSGGTAPYTFLNLGLPEYLESAVDENAGTLTISGTPAEFGYGNVYGEVEDASGASLTFNYSFYIKAKVNLTFGSTPNPSAPGDTVTFSLVVEPSAGYQPTGNIEFYDGTGDLAGCEETFPWNSDTTLVECSTAMLGAGVHQIRATYDPAIPGSIFANAEAILEHTVLTPVTITVGPETIAQGQVGAAYSQPFTASGGTEPYTFASTGTLPNGLSLNQQGLLSGTPTEAGDFPITVTATDHESATGSRDYTLMINPAPPLTLMPERLPAGGPGIPYSVQLSVTGDNLNPPYTYAVVSGELPAGLTLSETGLLSGTAEWGEYTFTIQARGADAQTVTRAYTLLITQFVISGILFIDLDSDGLLDADETGRLDGTIDFDQDCDGTAWDHFYSVDSAGYYYTDALPAGTCYRVTPEPFDDYGGQWIPTSPIPYDLTSLQADMTVNFGFRENPLSISPLILPDAILDASYNQTVIVSGGTAPYTYTVLNNQLPTGLSLSFAEEGDTGVFTISGTPTKLENETGFTVQVQDSAGNEIIFGIGIRVKLGVSPVFDFTSSPSPSTGHEPVTFTFGATRPGPASKYPNPYGWVDLYDDDLDHPIDTCMEMELGEWLNEEGVLVDQNPVTCTTTALTVGTHTIIAVFHYSDYYPDGTVELTHVVNADTTAPGITADVQGTTGMNSWYTSDVTLTWTVTDNESDITTSTGCDDVTIISDQLMTDYTCTATSSGGTNSDTVTIGRDATAPAVTLTADRDPDVYGWYNKTIDFTVSGDDATSGIASCDSNFTYSSPDSATAALNRTCTDNAGNKGTSETFNFQYDATKPVVTLTGVTEGSVYVQGSVPEAGCATTDALAGVLTQAALSVTGGNPDGTGSFTATCSGALDNAGNAGDPAIVHYTVNSPSSYILKIDKTTNGADGLEVLVGAPITWQYVVTNVSSSNLNNIVVTDDQLGQVCKINRLAPEASRTCMKTGVAVAGAYSNTGTATVVSNGTTYTASDDSSYFGAAPAIDVEKLVSVDLGTTWQDADSPTGPNVIVGDPVQFKFVITNTGNIDLSTITLSDTDLSPLDCSTPATLAAGSSYECVVEIPATIGQHTNTATATGDYGGITYTDSDNANYHGGNAIQPDIAINSLTITINKTRTTVSGQFIITDETKDGTTPDGFLVDLTDYGLDWEAKAAKTNVYTSIVPSGGCTYTIVAVDHEQAPDWQSGDPITFDETVTIRYTCTFGDTQLPVGGTLRGTAWAYIFDQMDMEYTFIATKVIPK